MTTCILADIGNTSFRVAIWQDGHITKRLDLDLSGLDFFTRMFSAESGFDVRAVALASVATSQVTAQFAKSFARACPGAPLRVIAGDMPGLPLNFARGFTQKKQVGADRLANAMAAIALKKFPCVIADFGTALTVDGVNENGEFAGGMILPGMATLLNAMHIFTARLPQLEIPQKPFEKPFGQNTRDAMLAGVEHGYRGLAREAVQTLQRALCGKVSLLATGGMAGRAATAAGLEFEILPDLTLLGIAQVLDTGETP